MWILGGINTHSVIMQLLSRRCMKTTFMNNHNENMKHFVSGAPSLVVGIPLEKCELVSDDLIISIKIENNDFVTKRFLRLCVLSVLHLLQ